MAKNVKIAGVTYDNVPQVNIPLATGSGSAVFYDASSGDVTANDVRKGKTAFGSNGSVSGNLDTITGTTTDITTKAQEVSIASGIHDGSGKVKISSTEQNKIIASNIKSGVTILGVAGSLTAASISQDGSTKVLSIS